eukprot:scaffold4112_cov60-Cylindrotheca_fusiformis.AAC.6
MIRALCDSGASTTIMDKKFAKKLRIRRDNTTVWNTAGGTLTTTEKAKIRFQLPQLSTTMTVATDVHLTNGISDRYDIIIGRDLMRELGLKLIFDDDVIEFHDLSVPMSDIDVQPREELKFATGIKEPASAAEAVDRVSRILDAKYAPVTPQQILDNSPHLTDEQKCSLKVVLDKHEKLFDGTLGKWKGVQQTIELKDPNTTPIACRPYPVPVKNKLTL